MMEHIHTGWVRYINGDRYYVPGDKWVLSDDDLECPNCRGRLQSKIQMRKRIQTACSSCCTTAIFRQRTVFRLTK